MKKPWDMRAWMTWGLMPAFALLWATHHGLAGEEGAAHPLYSRERPPRTPSLQELEPRESISQYGVTWTFEKKVPAGRFVNGDWYVVGPVTVVSITPGWDGVKNGSMLNISPVDYEQSGLDSRMAHKRIYNPKLTAQVPISMKPGDALVSSIGLEKSRDYPVDSLSVLTCLKEPVPPDAFRPGYTDREQSIYLARNLRREMMPRLAKVEHTPDLQKSANRFARLWHEVQFFEGDQASYQRGGYGRAVCEEVSRATLLLSLDFTPEEKEPLLVNFTQYGLDLWGLVKNGYRGWTSHGGWGSGRKWPIVYSGILLGEEKMAGVGKTFPKTWFHEDLQTLFDDCWTGAGVVWSGHNGHVRAANESRNPAGLGPYEHLHPSRWVTWEGTSYRTNMTSNTWVAEALAIRIMQAEKAWGGDAFLAYCDRWMNEPDPGYGNWGLPGAMDSSKQGNTWDPFFSEMWSQYRENLPALNGQAPPPRPTTAWQKTRELKSASVAVGPNREFLVQGRPFFPLMIFAVLPDRIQDAVAIGANVIAEGSFEPHLTSNQAALSNNRAFLDQLAAQGLYGVFGADMRAAGHPNLLGWIHLDAPDGVLGMPLKERSKSSGPFPSYRILHWAMEADPIQKERDEALLLVEPAYRWMKKADPSRPVFLSVGEAWFKALAEGQKNLCVEYLKSCEAVGCKVSGEHLGEAVGKLRELAGPEKPVYAWIETRGAQPDAVRAQVRASIARGATAIGYRGFESPKPEIKPEAEVLAELKRINDLITSHAAELLADPARAETLLK